MSRLALTISAFLVAGTAIAAEFPTISIERTCSAAKPLDAPDTQPVENCTREEREARSQLEAKWRSFAENNRRICAEQTNIGGYPSYADVLTCLEMYGPSSAGSGMRPKHKFAQ
jgi:hypothetical protein